MDLTDNGRYTVGVFALIAAGFAFGGLAGVELRQEGALSILAGAATLLIIASRRGRNGNGHGNGN